MIDSKLIERSNQKRNIYRSIRRLLALLRKNGCSLEVYLNNTVITEQDSIYKYLMALNKYLLLKRLPNGTFKIGNEKIHFMKDLLEVINNSNFNDDISCMYYSFTVIDDDYVYTLIYHDCIEKQYSRVDNFVINTNGVRR